jgi:hypothetical protein
VTGTLVGAVLHSLEVSTFLASEAGGATTLAGRFVGDIERIFVFLQVGLFVVAVRRNCARR